VYTHSSLVICVLWAACCLSASIPVLLNVNKKITKFTFIGKLFFSGSYCKALSLACISYETQLVHCLIPVMLIVEDVRSLWVTHSHCESCKSNACYCILHKTYTKLQFLQEVSYMRQKLFDVLVCSKHQFTSM